MSRYCCVEGISIGEGEDGEWVMVMVEAAKAAGLRGGQGTGDGEGSLLAGVEVVGVAAGVRKEVGSGSACVRGSCRCWSECLRRCLDTTQFDRPTLTARIPPSFPIAIKHLMVLCYL